MQRFTALTILLFVSTGCAGILPPKAKKEDAKAEPPRMSAEHEFLSQFVGEWDTEADAYLGPGQPSVKSKGTMNGRMIGGYWAVVDVKGEMMSRAFQGQGTFGYDPGKQKYVGTWIDSMMNHFWWYEGSVEGSKLILETEGPHPQDPQKIVKYRDTWEFKGKDLLVLTSEMQGPENGMIQTMTATCTRKS